MTTALRRIGFDFCDDILRLAPLVTGDAVEQTLRASRLASRAVALRVIVSRQFSDDGRGVDQTRLLEESVARALAELRTCNREPATELARTAVERGELFLSLFRKHRPHPALDDAARVRPESSTSRG